MFSGSRVYEILDHMFSGSRVYKNYRDVFILDTNNKLLADFDMMDRAVYVGHNLTTTLNNIFGLPWSIMSLYLTRYFHSTMRWGMIGVWGNYALMNDEIQGILKLRSIPFEEYIS